MLSEDKDYDVSLSYDNNGYVNKFAIENLESNKITTESNTIPSNNNGSTQVPSIDSSEYEQMKEEMEQKFNEMKEEYNNR